jgi:uncharacterized protein YbbC (DUF1343 family)
MKQRYAEQSSGGRRSGHAVIFRHFARLSCLLALLLISAGASAVRGLYDTSIRPGDTDTAAYLLALRGKRVALVINKASSVNGTSLLDILLRNNIRVVKVFFPEHGFRGTEDAGAKVDNTMDSATHVPLVSLYGSHKKPLPTDLADVDIVVYDLQDVGLRFYTYISTLEYCMEACAENGKQMMVLDRPDPNGFYVDGPVLEKENRSFVGMQPIPVVYGMTAGEYAQMLKGEGWFNKAELLDLKVIRCINYTHGKKYQLPVAPSPNLRTMAAIYAYPSLCLFEGTKISVGRGTDLPFQQYGCPEFESRFSYTFTPHSVEGAKNPPYENKVCYGEIVGHTEEEVLHHINDHFDLEWLIEAYNAYPDKNSFFTPFFLKLAGTTTLKSQLEQGVPVDEIRSSWKKDIAAFMAIRKKYLLYKDF